MTDPRQVMQDPEFLKLSDEDKRAVLSRIDPDFAALSDTDKAGVIAHLGQPSQQPAAPVQAPVQDQPTQPNGMTIDQIRAANNARPFWKKILGLPATGTDTASQRAADEQKVAGALQDNYQAVADVPIGAAKAAGQTLVGADDLVRSGLNKLGADYKPYEDVLGIDKNTLEPTNGAQKAGGVLENVLEFMSGEGELKALSTGEKLKKLGVVAEFLEKHPSLMKLVGPALRQGTARAAQAAEFLEEHPRIAQLSGTALRQGTVGAAQAAVHGDPHPIETGIETGVTGSALEGIGGGVSNKLKSLAEEISPKYVNIADESIPMLASQEQGASDLAKKSANIESEPAIKKRQQEGVHYAVGNIATDAANSVLSKFGQSVDSVGSFGDAAKKLRDAAKPVFQRLDELSDNEYSGLKGQMDAARKVMRSPSSYEAQIDAQSKFNDAQNRIDKLFTKYGDQVGAEDLKNAQSAWKTSKVLDKIHNAVEGSFNVPKDVADRTGLNRELSGNKLNARLHTLLDKIPDQVYGAIGQEGVDNLHLLADLTSTTDKAGALNRGIDAIAKEMQTKYLGQSVVGTYKLVRDRVIHSLATSPFLLKSLAYDLDNRTLPRLYAPLIARAISNSHKQEDEQQ